MNALQLIADLAGAKVLFSISVIGLFSSYRIVFGRALILVLFTVIYNVYLKSLWKLPLPPGLGLEGFAFPSGHMHAAIVFWGWLFIEFPFAWLRSFLMLLLAGIAFSLVHLGYHYPLDIFGAIAFGTLSLTLYHWLSTLSWFSQVPARLGLVALSLVPWFILHLPSQMMGSFFWLSLITLVSFTLGWLLLSWLTATKPPHAAQKKRSSISLPLRTHK